MIVESDGFLIDFTDALHAFKFDETDRAKPTFHGAPMKAVDIVATFDCAYVFVEIKDFYEPEKYDEKFANDGDGRNKNRDAFHWLKDYLKYKYRDTCLYRCAEDKFDKPVHYICLLNAFDNALNGSIKDALRRELPVGFASSRWQLEIAKSCHAVNLAKWNEVFPKWPAKRL